MKTYHKAIGFPRGFTPPEGNLTLIYSQHALYAALSDRYGVLSLPKTLNLTSLNKRASAGEDCGLVEITFDAQGMPLKGVYRIPRGGLILVIVVLYQSATVKTVWANLPSDNHTTLRRENYAVPA